MAKIKSTERVVEYTSEFKVRVVELTQKLAISASDIAHGLGLHPVMVYRWRQEYREGLLVDHPTRRIAMTKETLPTKRRSPDEEKELKRLRKENDALKKENDFLKKWERYLKAQKQNGSRS